MISVTKATAYDGVFVAAEALMTDADKDAIRAAAVRARYGDAGFYAMRLGDLLDAMDGRLDGVATQQEAETVFGVYRLKAFPDWLNEFLTVTENLTPKPTAKETRVTQGCLKMTFGEAVYVFCRKYFGLQSFDAVGDLTVGDYLLAKKDDYNRIVADRNAMRMAKTKGGM